MRRGLAGLALVLSILAACGGGSPTISDDAAAELHTRVSAVRTAVGARDADLAARALATLRHSVTRLRRTGDISGDRAREILSAATAVQGELVSITTTTTTTTSTTVLPTLPRDAGDDNPGNGKGKGNDKGED